MIVSLLRLPCFAALAAVGCWVIWLAANATHIPEVDGHELAGLYLDRQAEAARLRWAEHAASKLEAFIPLGILGRLHAIKPGLRTTALHARISWDLLPIVLHLSFAGALAGAVFRERLRTSDGSYASPTAAFLGRAAVTGSGLYLLVFAVTPLPAPYASLYLAGVAMSIGGLLYAANLPLKL